MSDERNWRDDWRHPWSCVGGCTRNGNFVGRGRRWKTHAYLTNIYYLSRINNNSRFRLFQNSFCLCFCVRFIACTCGARTSRPPGRFWWDPSRGARPYGVTISPSSSLTFGAVGTMRAKYCRCRRRRTPPPVRVCARAFVRDRRRRSPRAPNFRGIDRRRRSNFRAKTGTPDDDLAAVTWAARPLPLFLECARNITRLVIRVQRK